MFIETGPETEVELGPHAGTVCERGDCDAKRVNSPLQLMTAHAVPQRTNLKSTSTCGPRRRSSESTPSFSRFFSFLVLFSHTLLLRQTAFRSVYSLKTENSAAREMLSTVPGVEHENIPRRDRAHVTKSGESILHSQQNLFLLRCFTSRTCFFQCEEFP